MGSWVPGGMFRDGRTVYSLIDYGDGPENRWWAPVQAGRHCPEEEAVAVAELFEAASDLYEALEQARREYGVLTRLSGETLVQMDAALARARGDGP